ncbi:MAG: hypothetical protein MUF60_07570, partial [Vicinamibacterales bacterium]|nr:hypothetical protein [Vicinamibacterales bacterium]
MVRNGQAGRVAIAGLAAAALVVAGGATLDAQARRPPLPQRPAPNKPAAAQVKMPEVTVGGIQVVNAAFGDDDWSARPFNSTNGTKVVLVIKMPPGMGLIEIDEDESSLDTFTDEKTTQYAAEFESFPDVTKDGSAGAIEIQSEIIPGAGMHSLVAEGTLAIKVATGVKPVKVTGLRPENDKSFKLGSTVVTYSDVTPPDDPKAEDAALAFTLNLPRAVMAGIKQVKFTDAKGVAIEDARRTSSGYMNDDASMGFSVPAQHKTFAMEFEMWQ